MKRASPFFLPSLKNRETERERERERGIGEKGIVVD
jgi:hypothetical protein